jgi:hypothetical protein
MEALGELMGQAITVTILAVMMLGFRDFAGWLYERISST